MRMKARGAETVRCTLRLILRHRQQRLRHVVFSWMQHWKQQQSTNMKVRGVAWVLQVVASLLQRHLYRNCNPDPSNPDPSPSAEHNYSNNLVADLVPNPKLDTSPNRFFGPEALGGACGGGVEGTDQRDSEGENRAGRG